MLAAAALQLIAMTLAVRRGGTAFYEAVGEEAVRLNTFACGCSCTLRHSCVLAETLCNKHNSGANRLQK